MGAERTPAQQNPGISRAPSSWWNSKTLWLAMVLLGILLRIAVVALPGNRLRATWSGGGDGPNYVLLATNLLQGKGFTYASQSTALRAPGYPLLLAALIWLFDAKYILALRWIQFALGLGTVYFCWRASTLAFSKRAARTSFIIGVFFPTLVFITGEVLTECIGAFLAAVFLYLVVEAIKKPRTAVLIEMGLLIGVAALFRFNMAVLIFVGIWVAFATKTLHPVWQRALVLCFFAGITVSPWLIRNQIVFHGQVLYSTLSGHDAVEGILTPQGRALPGDTAKLEAAEGWSLQDVETNSPSRLRLPSEADLNHEAWRVARGLWRQWGTQLLLLEFAKCSYFWLSLDQVLWTQSFSLGQRVLRWGGVLLYWVFLGFAAAGWFRTRESDPALGRGFLMYVILVTILHLPFPMITRLRIPFMDPLITILGGAVRR